MVYVDFRLLGRSGRVSTVTRTVTSAAEHRFLTRPVNIGVVGHRRSDVGMAHKPLENLGGHLSSIATAEAFAKGVHRQLDPRPLGQVHHPTRNDRRTDRLTVALHEPKDPVPGP